MIDRYRCIKPSCSRVYDHQPGSCLSCGSDVARANPLDDMPSLPQPYKKSTAVTVDVNVRIEAEKLHDCTWIFRIFDRDGRLVSDKWRHPGPDFEAGIAYAALVQRWRTRAD